jgi:hypothetical protein
MSRKRVADSASGFSARAPVPRSFLSFVGRLGTFEEKLVGGRAKQYFEVSF